METGVQTAREVCRLESSAPHILALTVRYTSQHSVMIVECQALNTVAKKACSMIKFHRCIVKRTVPSSGVKKKVLIISFWIFLGLLLDPEERGSMFLRKIVGLLSEYKEPLKTAILKYISQKRCSSIWTLQIKK
jgi:hypothetical protein